ncbi:hypothetical protein HK105_207204 [Polyrhizophydium stewartii]|uniref:Ankyrin repeat protein n=1 Tax=Polyrhizophydium stewartii TaxID=2732419 RepID=A0ABR4N1B1_9FUNG|nr:hypothetical protein HK105_003388 [Polyrhizophydium stewartii]
MYSPELDHQPLAAAELVNVLNHALAPLVDRLDSLQAQSEAYAAATLERICRLEEQNGRLLADVAALRLQLATAREPPLPPPTPPQQPHHPPFVLTAAAAKRHSQTLAHPPVYSPANSPVQSPVVAGRQNMPFTSSHWDRIPGEMQADIVARAGPLTQYVNGRIEKLSWDQFKTLWTEVFASDWQGDISKLPIDRFKSCPWFESFWHLRTRSMHARVKQLGHGFLKDGLVQAAVCNWWTDLLDFSKPRELSINAAKCGSISMLMHLVYERQVVTFETQHVVEAACYGHLDLLKWLGARMMNGTWTTAVMDWAAVNGKLDCAKWLHANRTEGCTVNAMNMAAKNGHLDTVAWLHRTRREGCTTDAMDLAAEYGQAAVVEFLHTHMTEGCTRRAMLAAAENGHADVVEFLHKNRPEGDIGEAAVAAARNGRLNVIRRIHEIEPEAITAAVADRAATQGRTGVLDWIVRHTDVRCTADAISRAAKGGHLRLLAWFRDNMPEQFRAHSMSKIGVHSADAAIDWFKRSKLPTRPADVLRAAIKELNIDAVRWLLWHLHDTKWHKGDAEYARSLMRVV